MIEKLGRWFGNNLYQEMNNRSQSARSRLLLILGASMFVFFGSYPNRAHSGEPYINLGRLFEDALVLQLWSVERLNEMNLASGPNFPPPLDRTMRTAIYSLQVPADFGDLASQELCMYFRRASYNDWQDIGRESNVIDSWPSFDRPASVELHFEVDPVGKLDSATAIGAIATTDERILAEFIDSNERIAPSTKEKLQGVLGFKYSTVLKELDSFAVRVSDLEECDDFMAFMIEVSQE